MELQVNPFISRESANDSLGVYITESFPTVGSASEIKAQLQALVEKGGPDLKDYTKLDQTMATLYAHWQYGRLSQREIEDLKSVFHDSFLNATIHGHAYLKPFGYAGDFLLIDKIYTHHHARLAEYKKWDRYFHYCEATEAVRNRKEYFKKLMLKKLSAATTPLQLLDVASGPARDVQELYGTIDPKTLSTTCVDVDARAIDYATDLCKAHTGQIRFVHKNILRFSTPEKFDVIWSAGLFDYFEDRIFVTSIKKFLTWLKPGGEIIVGNFSEDNSTRGYMEMFGEWNLIHRSKEELTRLALLAGAREENIHVEQEPLGINLFLRITA
ncbi:class I SAM-dependent methyltransferase [Dawidia soli]|uniref:Class I SAM-dependent methyltransferase n=1 Tax=Dawidia soli TaxID=2782352 RepID=A0AAP2GD64_9BACT|nr:class I SAM-dependent methyltransferase [Dawidia soli]MBT1687034.1 class I SAM-dependent methyltransferase [Dawidia soli]